MILFSVSKDNVLNMFTYFNATGELRIIYSIIWSKIYLKIGTDYNSTVTKTIAYNKRGGRNDTEIKLTEYSETKNKKVELRDGTPRTVLSPDGLSTSNIKYSALKTVLFILSLPFVFIAFDCQKPTGMFFVYKSVTRNKHNYSCSFLF